MSAPARNSTPRAASIIQFNSSELCSTVDACSTGTDSCVGAAAAVGAGVGISAGEVSVLPLGAGIRAGA